MPKYKTWIIKLGGSLIGSPQLAHWIDTIVVAGRRHRIVVVAGGGVFADVVRDVQHGLGIDDHIAHQLALQAMRQFATVLAFMVDRKRGTRLASINDIERANGSSGIWIWEPCDRRLAESNLPQDWRVTSDSVSLWLSGEFDSSRLLLVKMASPDTLDANVAQLSAAGYVDAYFADLWPTLMSPTWWLSKTQAGTLIDLLDGEQLPDQLFIGS